MSDFLEKMKESFTKSSLGGKHALADAQNTYGGFLKPRVKIKLNKKTLTLNDGLVIDNLKLALTSEFDANFASFGVHGVANENERTFKEGVGELFDIGSRIDIYVGYGEDLELGFTGFICGLSYCLPQKGDGQLVVNCMDVKGVMMNNNNYAQKDYKRPSDLASDLLERSQYAAFYSNLEIDKTPDELKFIEVTDESDYELMVRLARKIDYEFFVAADTVYFRKARKQTATEIVFEFGLGLESLEVDYNILGMVNSVEVRNTDTHTGEQIMGQAKSSAVYSNSSSAAKVLKSAKKIVLDSTICSSKEAQLRAEAKLEEINWGFGTAKFTLAGQPQLQPGCFILLKGVFEKLDKKFYVVRVEHTIEKNKFKTVVTARLCSL